MICRARALMLAIATTAFSLAYTEAPSRDCQAVGKYLKILKSIGKEHATEVRRWARGESRKQRELDRLTSVMAQIKCNSSRISPSVRLHCRGLRIKADRISGEIGFYGRQAKFHQRWVERYDNKVTDYVEDNLVCFASICTTDFRRIPNQAIAGNNLYSLSNLSVNQCKAKCLADSRCMSFDYGRRIRLCVISDKDSSDVANQKARWARPAGRSDWPYDYYQRSCR